MEFKFILIAPLLLGGLYFIISGLTLQKRSREATKWPTVPGEIIDSGLQSLLTHSRQRNAVIRFRLTAKYRFQVDDQEYTGSRIFFWNELYKYEAAINRLSIYRVGSKVLVHYDPDNPANAVLEVKAAGSVPLLIIGGVLMVIGVLAAIFLPEA